jgi:hypothetical protein
MTVIVKGVTVVKGATVINNVATKQVQIPGAQFINQTGLKFSAQVPGGPFVNASL